jgi:preprotein translocase subunit SecA
VGLRGYAARDPLTEFKLEGYNLFMGTMAQVSADRGGEGGCGVECASLPAKQKLKRLGQKTLHPRRHTKQPHATSPQPTHANPNPFPPKKIRRNVIYNVFVFQPQRVRPADDNSSSGSGGSSGNGSGKEAAAAAGNGSGSGSGNGRRKKAKASAA